jgi:hypothetical protein
MIEDIEIGRPFATEVLPTEPDYFRDLGAGGSQIFSPRKNER